MTASADIGLVGLAVMGRNLALNMDDHGFRVAVFNRTTERVREFIDGAAADTNIIGTYSLEELVTTLRPPRKIMLMIKAGGTIDAAINALLPLLEKGDIVIDGGNSLYADTRTRTERLESLGLRFIGTGVSGGESGARNGPALMPGGSEEAWPHIRNIFQSIAAKVDGIPCCEWVGADGAGHYVKMVHNGIEYGDMQVIAEAYDIMSRGLDLNHSEMHDTFTVWNDGPLDSYLIEITSEIMLMRDTDGVPLLEKILDSAGQKGTGKWTVISSMELNQPTALIAEAVCARIVSALRHHHLDAYQHIKGPKPTILGTRSDVLSDLQDAMYASKIVSYAQGFMLLTAAAEEYGWTLDLGAIASIWRGGCIIRSRFLSELMSLYRDQPDLPNILMSEFFGLAIKKAQPGWRRTITRAVNAGIPVPVYASALAFFDSYRAARVPANLIQAQRDYFGAHTYERTDKPRGEFFHTDWTNQGADTTSQTCTPG